MLNLSVRGQTRPVQRVARRNNNCADRKRAAVISEALEPRRLMARPYGVDVSDYQGTINWTSAKNAGTVFAFAKATEGFTFDATTFTANMTNGKNAGVLMGAYHFARPDNNTAADEVSHFLAIAGNYIKSGYMQPVLDFENPVQAGDVNDTKAELSAWANAWMQGVFNATGVKPLLYTYPSYATSYLDSTVTQWPLWMASYSGANEQTGAPPTSPWSSGTWKFWQYTSTGTVAGIAGNVDRNVFNGDLTGLNSWVIPAIPSTPTPVNNATVSSSGLVLNWADAQYATSYDVYLDSVFKANVATSQWTVSSALANGNHTWRIVSKNNTGSITGPTWNFNVQDTAPGVPSTPSPANNALLAVRPTKLDWANTAGATSYDVYLGTNPTPFATTISELAVTPSDGVRLWRVVAKNGVGNTTGPQWSYTLDTNAPVASYFNNVIDAGSSTFDVSIDYTDATSGVDVLLIDTADVTIAGPGGYSASPLSFTIDNATNGSPRRVTYRFPAPGGVMTRADNGNYAISINSNQVKDVAGNTIAAHLIYNMPVNVAFAYKSGATAHVDFGSAAQPITLQYTSAGDVLAATENGVSYNLTGVSNIIVNGTAADDTLSYDGPIPQSIAFNGNGGDDNLEIANGAHTFSADIAAMNSSGTMSLIVSSTGQAIFDASQRLKNLTLADGAVAALWANGDRLLHLDNLSVGPTSRLDLNDNDLVVDNGTFADLQGLVLQGFNGTTGITSSTSDGTQILALFDNSLIGAADWGGQTIAPSAIVGKYTYFGDLNFDGQVSGDDYGVIDGNLDTTPPAGIAWLSGDANLDGIVTGDDYGTIDGALGLGAGNPLALALSDPPRKDLLSS